MATQTEAVVYKIWLVPNPVAIVRRTKDRLWWMHSRVQVGYKVTCSNGSCCPTFATRKQAKRYIAVRKDLPLDW